MACHIWLVDIVFKTFLKSIWTRSHYLRVTFFRLLGLPFTNDLSWNKYIDQISKSASKKVGSLYRARQFLTEEIILYLYKSAIRICMEHCCHVWCGASAASLGTLDKIQRRLRYLVGDDLFSKLQPLSHRLNMPFWHYFTDILIVISLTK